MEALIELLNKKTNVDEYKIKFSETSSTELFFIKDELQMNRGKLVNHIEVTVYRNFEDSGSKYKGSSTVKLSPTMTIKEMEAKIDAAALAASFVKNEYYDLVSPTKEVAPAITSKFNDGEAINHISNLVKDLYQMDHLSGAFINSVEFFINKDHIRLINSLGLDISYDSVNGLIELITEAKGETEEIELFDFLRFSDYDPEWIKEVVKDALIKANLRTKAIPLPNVGSIPVILTGEAVSTFFSYYRAKASGKMAYEGISTAKIGDMVQTGEITGDKVSITMKSVILNSSHNYYYDSDGVFIKNVEIIENGKLLTYATSKKFADYLKIVPSGEIHNLEVRNGSKSIAELKQGTYLELLNFSDFQMDPLTGNFAGEIRLGIYHDGNKEIPVTLGSISGEAKVSETDMYFSKELQKNDCFIGPKLIKLNRVTIAGN